MIGSGFSYFPMVEGHFIEYVELNITGTWHPTTMKLDVNTVVHANPPGVRLRIESLRHAQPAYIGYLQHWSYNNQPQDPINYYSGLVDTPFVYPPNILGLGEVRNEQGWTMYPPECLLTKNPVAGETISAVSRVSNPDGSFRGNGPWTYRTIAHYDDWGPDFQDVWRTALKEDTGLVYNFAFMKDVGMVDIWLINPATGIGKEYYAVLF